MQLRDVRRELQDVLHERDVAVARGAKVEDLEETVSELRRQNKELEDQASGSIRAKGGGGECLRSRMTCSGLTILES